MSSECMSRRSWTLLIGVLFVPSTTWTSFAGQVLLQRSFDEQLEEQVWRSVWQVRKGERPLGTAFLVHEGGYFATASHVVRDASGTVLQGLSLALPDLEDPSVIVAAKEASIAPGSDLCQKVSSEVGCTQGYDVVILRAAQFDTGSFEPLDMSLSPRLQAFHGRQAGYPIGATGMRIGTGGVFSIRAVPETGTTGTRFYQSDASIARGDSGGPVFMAGEPPRVMGLVSWGKGRETGSDFSYVVSAAVAHSVLTALEIPERVQRSIAVCRGNAPEPVNFKGFLRTLTSQELGQLVKSLPDCLDDSGGPKTALLQLYYRCDDKGLFAEMNRLFSCVRSEMANFGFLSARSYQLLAEAQNQEGEYGSSLETYSEAVGLYTEFFARPKDPEEFRKAGLGASAFSTAALDFAVAQDRVGNATDAASWMAMSHFLTPMAVSSAELGRYFYAQKEYYLAALLYADAYQRGLQKEYVSTSYEKALTLAGEQAAPSNEFAIAIGTPIDAVEIQSSVRRRIEDRVRSLMSLDAQKALNNLSWLATR